jgi:CPA2 family monovalent cation:H+ antiporter-2
MHQVLLSVSIMCVVILLLILLLRRYNQPYLFAYIIAGIILGPQVTGVFSSVEETVSLGDLGILLLMFFLGIEINIPDKRNDLRIPVVAQLIRTLVSLAFAFVIGKFLHWKFENSLLIAILLVFNSTAVVFEFLKKNGELQTFSGKIVLNILVLQDLLIGPVLTIFKLMSND